MKRSHCAVGGEYTGSAREDCLYCWSEFLVDSKNIDKLIKRPLQV